jgi:Flp pilus assembly pilin Flp
MGNATELTAIILVIIAVGMVIVFQTLRRRRG